MHSRSRCVRSAAVARAVVAAGVFALAACGDLGDDGGLGEAYRVAQSAPNDQSVATDSVGDAVGAAAATAPPVDDAIEQSATSTIGGAPEGHGAGDAVELLPRAHCAGPAATSACLPATLSGRKILDQNGDVYLMRTFASWSLASNLSNEEITSALEAIRGRGFNAVTFWVGGGYSLDGGWDRYTNAAGESFWAGDPWRSELGPGWSSVDWAVSEARRLGMTANLSFCGGNGTTGARADWEQASNEEMHDAGAAIAQRYSAFDNIVWHVMFDDADTPDSVAGDRIDALFQGINDAEGAQARPIRWGEPNNGTSIYSQLLSGPTFDNVNITMNGLYDYGSNSVELVEAVRDQDGALSMPFGDVEPPYDGSPHFDTDPGQQLRERSYAVFLEGGSFINYGHEDWWPFGAGGLYSEGIQWRDVPADQHTIEQSHAWALIDAFVADPLWVPDDGSFLTGGEGAGDTKAAVGHSDTSALVYLPTPREVTIDTTRITSASRVRLRWYDPTTGTFALIADGEDPTTNRVVGELPMTHPDGAADWVLVVDSV